VAFLGQFEYTLDAKNRLTIPAKFRDEFKAGAILSQEFEGCVSVWPAGEWAAYIEQALGTRDPFSPEARRMERLLHSSSFEVKLDGAGRVMLPPSLMARGGLSKDVTVIGVRRRLEVWDRERWTNEESVMNATAAQSAQRLSGSRDTSS
jgi:MraZ protein